MLNIEQRKTGQLSFKKSHRLLNPKDYKMVFDGVELKQGGGYFTFLSRKNQLSCSRLGVIVAKKHISLAVNRNKIKRAIRESFRHFHPKVEKVSEVNTHDCLIEQEKLKMFFDTVVLVKSSADKLNSSELKRELNQQWLKLNKKQN